MEDKRIRLIVAHQASMQFGLDIGLMKPSTDTCGSGGYTEPFITFCEIKPRVLMLSLSSNFNDGNYDKFKVRKQTMRYRYVDGRYQEAGR